MSNPYLAKLHGIIGTQRGQNLKTWHPVEPSKPSKPGSEGFAGDRGSPFFKFEVGAGDVGLCRIEDAQSQKTIAIGHPQNPQNSSHYDHVFAVFCDRCPNHVDSGRWQCAVDDGSCFLAQWGEQAEALGWTVRDLFGLHDVPANPHPSYQRLSRYDCTGLIWLLQGCPVVALTEATAAIRMPSGNVTTYRKNNKPAFGPLGDSLDDFLA
jgi:hypothetical protein